MIVFLYGRDSYRLKQNLERITDEYNKKNASGMSFSVLDFDDAPLGEQSEKLTDLIKTNTFFDEKRLIVLKNFFPAADRITSLIKEWDLVADKQRIFVFIENRSEEELSKKDKKLFNLLSGKPNVVKRFEPLDAKKLEKWAGDEIGRLGGRIESAALRKLVSLVVDGKNKNLAASPAFSWQLKQEIDKLLDYKIAGKDGIIRTSDVELLVPSEIELNIFDLVDAFAAKSKPRALFALHNHLESGADPYYIFSMLVFQFRNLLRVKSLAQNAIPYSDIVKKTGLNPFVIRKSYEQCKKFDLEELKRLFSKLARIELDSKNGKTEMADGLYKFIFALT